ncbi:ATP-binding protein [Streptomyces sp. RB6PN23]|uniref:histidine kinase n=1 Tax=Streptomyces silvisoli TaxID=3034235 RepID=A0ABT5ZIK4_9ACTN|nr:ATP-binding protein [Streptomyces silvisoli]MDF3289663.1 ATP-binding protein [Streptomyces silvisoli]
MDKETPYGSRRVPGGQQRCRRRPARYPARSAEGLPRAFEPFQRLGDTDDTTGLGLGLALSRGFTEAMGGTLLPEDTPGGGLTMVVSLPAAPALQHPVPA